MRSVLIRFALGILVSCLGAVVLIWVPVQIFGPHGIRRLKSLAADLDTTHQEIDRFSERISGLEQELIFLKTSPRAIERIARDELGMVHPNEMVFQFASEADISTR